MNLYTFHREGFFYPIELENDQVALDCIACNPGTLKVTRWGQAGETVIYEQPTQEAQ